MNRRTGAGARINADHIGLYRLIVVGILGAAAAAIITSWNGLVAVADWQGLPEQLRWVTPVMIDVPIVVLTLGALAKRSRGESPRAFLALSIVLTGISASANFVHTWAIDGLPEWVERLVGASLNGIAPGLVLLTTEVLGSLVTRPKRVRKVKRRRAASKPAAAAPLHVVEEASA